MERRFLVFCAAMILLAVAGLGVAGAVTYTQLHGAEARLEEGDMQAFRLLQERVSDTENVIGVRVSCASALGDYARYAGFDKAMLAGMEFVDDEYLACGTGRTDTDITLDVTLAIPAADTVWYRLLAWCDRNLDTDFVDRVEKCEMRKDEDVYRVTYQEHTFVVRCEAMTTWLEEK